MKWSLNIYSQEKYLAINVQSSFQDAKPLVTFSLEDFISYALKVCKRIVVLYFFYKIVYKSKWFKYFDFVLTLLISFPGNFSRITVKFEIEREFGHFLLDIYVPSILFVVTSWLSFWVEIPAAPARVTLSMTTMLTLVTSEKAIREKLPKVSYVHALDIWNVVCTGTFL